MVRAVFQVSINTKREAVNTKESWVIGVTRMIRMKEWK